MKSLRLIVICLFAISSCKSATKNNDQELVKDELSSDFTIAFGSCNNQSVENPFWNEILKNKPDVWVWGGDIIYSDTYDMAFLEDNYTIQKNNEVYIDFASKVEIIGTWDDHDYGQNDAGKEYSKKEKSQQLFLDFLDVPKDSPRRNQKGVYFSKDYKVKNGEVKIIILDTRYFRTELTESNDTTKRYTPNEYGIGSILGNEQWNWLKTELDNSEANFNIIMSSIQVLSSEHGWETWGNMPHEVDKLTDLIKLSKAKNTIILSGDRHISDFSSIKIEELDYPIIDFTSSGLTHSSTNNLGEPNKYRVGNLVNKKSFGILKFNFESQSVIMEMRGENNSIQQTHTQVYKN